MKEILVLGVGNLILKDEGIGIHTIHYMEQIGWKRACVDLMDGATGGFFLLGEIQEYKHLILIDATLDEYPAGTIRCLKPHYSSDYPALLSAHEVGLKDMIDAMLFMECIPNIDLIVVSVKNMQEVGMELSLEVKQAIPKIVEKVEELIKNKVHSILPNKMDL